MKEGVSRRLKEGVSSRWEGEGEREEEKICKYEHKDVISYSSNNNTQDSQVLYSVHKPILKHNHNSSTKCIAFHKNIITAEIHYVRLHPLNNQMLKK